MHQHWVTDQTSSDASLPFSFSGTSVSIGGSISPASRRRLLAWDRNLLIPWSSSTAELCFEVSISCLCFSKKSCTSDPNVERFSCESSSTNLATRRSGANTQTKAAVMRRRVDVGFAEGNRVPRAAGGHWWERSAWASSSSRLLKELLLSSSAREGARVLSKARHTSPSSVSLLSSVLACWGEKLI